MQSSRQTGLKGVFYGWWIVLTGTVLMAIQSGLYYYGFSVYFTPLRQEFGWSAATLSGVFGLSRLESGVSGPAVGFLIDRFGPRLLTLIGFVMAGIGFILLSQVKSIEAFYFVFIAIISVGGSLGFVLPINATIANWFIRKRSLALGIMSCGAGAAGLFAPILAWSIANYGWRMTAMGSGLILIISGLPIALVMRHRPETYGALPDGGPPVHSVRIAQDGAAAHGSAASTAVCDRIDPPSHAVAETDFSPKQALASRAFWVLAVVFTIRQVVTTAVAVHVMPAILNLGFSLEVASLALAAYTVISVPGRLAFGWIGDKWDKRYALALCYAMLLFGLLAFAYADSLFMIVLFLLVYSPAYGGLVPLTTATWAEYFGRQNFATIYGLSQIITMWGTIAGPVLAGYAFDVSESYQLAFLCFALLNVPGLLLLLFVRRPRAKPSYQMVSSE